MWAFFLSIFANVTNICIPLGTKTGEAPQTLKTMTTTATTLQAQLEDNKFGYYTKAAGRKATYEVDKVSGKRAIVANVRVNGAVVKQQSFPVAYDNTLYTCWDNAYAQAYDWCAQQDAE